MSNPKAIKPKTIRLLISLPIYYSPITISKESNIVKSFQFAVNMGLLWDRLLAQNL